MAWAISKRQISAAFVTLVAIFLFADVFHMAQSAFVDPSYAPLVEGDNSSIHVNNPVNAEAMIQWELFGRPSAMGKAPGMEVAKKATGLGLKLEGILLSSDGISYALIDGAGPNSLYQEGDQLGKIGVTLKRIEIGRVLIDNNGVLESLLLDENDSASALQAGNPGKPILQNPPPPALPLDFSSKRPSRVVISGNNPEKAPGDGFLDKANLTIVKTDGGPIKGYRINAIRPGDVLPGGLLEDDILVGINGKKMLSPIQALALRRQLRDSPELDLLVERKGSLIKIHINQD